MSALGMFQGPSGPAINHNQEIPLYLDLSHNNMKGTFPAWLVSSLVGASQNVTVNLQVGQFPNVFTTHLPPFPLSLHNQTWHHCTVPVVGTCNPQEPLEMHTQTHCRQIKQTMHR